MFTTDPLGLATIALRTAAVYVFLLLALRLAGKRELGQMTTFDLVVILIVANAVQNAMVGADTSLDGGLLAAAVLIALNAALGRLGLRFPLLQRHLEGRATILVHNGRPIPQHLAREGVSEDLVVQAAREHGLEDLSRVRLAVLEVDGTISIIPDDATIYHSRRKVRGRAPKER